jgi:hypothetical protein
MRGAGLVGLVGVAQGLVAGLARAYGFALGGGIATGYNIAGCSNSNPREKLFSECHRQEKNQSAGHCEVG